MKVENIGLAEISITVQAKPVEEKAKAEAEAEKGGKL